MNRILKFLMINILIYSPAKANQNKNCQIEMPEKIIISNTFCSMEEIISTKNCIPEIKTKLMALLSEYRGTIPTSNFLMELENHFPNNRIHFNQIFISLYSLNEIAKTTLEEISSSEFRLNEISFSSSTFCDELQKNSLLQIKESFTQTWTNSLDSSSLSPGKKTIALKISDKNYFLTTTLEKQFQGWRSNKEISLMQKNINLSKEDFEAITFYSSKEENTFDDIQKIHFYSPVKKLKKGLILNTHDLTLKQIISSNSPVTVYINKNDLILKTTGKALSAGRLGDTISVINPHTSKKYLTKIIDHHTVELSL